MTRLLSWCSVLLVMLMLVFPAVVAAQGSGDERGVLVGVREDLTLNSGSSAAVVVAVQGQLTISGHARLVVMVDGALSLEGASASVDTLVAVRATVTLGPGTTVGTIRSLDSTISQDPTATVQHGIEDLQGSMVVLVGALGTFLVLLYLGWAVAVLVAGAMMAAMAAGQTRRMVRSVSEEPLKVLGAGLVGFFVPMILGVLFFVTVIGIPLGVLVFMAWSLAAFVGYLVIGVWLGDLLLRRGRTSGDDRPVGSALLGLFLLLIASVIPLVSLFAGWLGLGTVTLNAWRSLARGGGSSGPPVAGAAGQGWPGQQAGWGPPAGGPQPQPGWGPPPAGGAQPQPGWTPPPGPGTPPPGWGTPAPGSSGSQPWGQPAPPAGPPAGWGQPPAQDR